MNDYQMIPVEGEMLYTVDYTAELPTGVTLTAVAWTISPQTGSPLAPTLGSQSNDYANAKSSIKVSSLTHAQTYVLQSKGTLSNGEVIPKDISLVALNG